jgi:hypothetical protein
VKLLAALSLLLLATPGVARAAELPSITSRDLPLVAAARMPAAQTPRFNLVGLHWRGEGSVSFRTRRLDGRWTAWRGAAPEAEDRPDQATGEASRPDWNLGNPHWVGASDRIEYRTRGRVTRLRGYFVWSPVGTEPVRQPALASAPLIIPRSSWGANELIKRGTPRYADNLSLAVVHHTAGANAYTREESAAIVRAIQLYHVQGNGWNDIGYNFLVDKYGQVFEGRFGGVERNVVGAHAEGFNTGSTGVAVLGSYGGAPISPAARDALVRLLAWRLDVAHIDPVSTLTFASGGNGRFPAGASVPLRAIVGHRDTGFTSCPGDALYRQLDGFAISVAASGGPKLFAPLARGRVGAPVRFTARLSAPLPWTVTVADRLGTQVATGAGTGTAIDWTWDATLAPQTAYTWSIAAGPTVRPATGTIGSGSGPVAPVLSVTQVSATPSTFTPNGDGIDDATTIVYTLGAAATVTATTTGPDGGVATIFTGAQTAGEQRFAWAADGLPDGIYRISLTATAGAATVTGTVDVVVTRTLSSFRAPRPAFSPNADGRADRFPVSFSLAAPAEVKLRILRDGRWIATPFAGPLQPGQQSLEWDGSKRIGRALAGTYEVELTVADAVGTVTRRQPFAVDLAPPTLGLITRRPLRVRVSEPGELVVRAGGRRVVVKAARAGIVRLPVDLPASVQAWDLAGNVARAVRYAPLRH